MGCILRNFVRVIHSCIFILIGVLIIHGNAFSGSFTDRRNVNRHGIPQREVSGKVTDENGDPLPGVNVIVKGTTGGTVTGVDGVYRLNMPNNDEVLVFSFIGYLTQSVNIGSRSTINISLQPKIEELDEVVVVGYGVQKKSNLTGSVSDIKSENIENRLSTQVSQVLAGQVSGIFAAQSSGQPGDDISNIVIRGKNSYETFGTTNNNYSSLMTMDGSGPLVIVDGMPSTMDGLDPNSILSISVLKDAASAAIYGARSANGVILITTKKGEKGKMKVSYRVNAGWQEAIQLPDIVNSWEYAQYFNEALINSGSSPIYSDDDILKFEEGSDPDYPNSSHLKDLFTSGSGFQTEHNLSFVGGSEKNSYYASIGYLAQNGLVAEDGYERYNYTLNLDQEVSKNLTLSTGFTGYVSNKSSPAINAGPLANNSMYAGNVRLLDQMVWFMPVTEPAVFPDGSYNIRGNWINYRAAIDGDSFGSSDIINFIGNATLAWDVLDDLKISGRASYQYRQRKDRAFAGTFRASEDLFLEPAYLFEDIRNDYVVLLQSIAEYNKTINKHSFYALAGYAQENHPSESYGLIRNDYPTNFQPVINGGSSGSAANSGDISDWSLRSFFTRIQYSYDDRYLFEANARYDGSSRFASDRKYGLFPSFSGAWRVSKENFFTVPWIDDMKIRSSWGEMGNHNNVGNYPYQNVLSLGQNVAIGNTLQPGAALTSLKNEAITWETTTLFDVGLDMTLFQGKLGFAVDYFDKRTKDILSFIPVSSVVGLSAPPVNLGEVLNRGWEFELSYKNQIGDLSYSVSPNFSTLQNELLYLPETDKIITRQANNFYTILQEGEPLDAFYGFVTDGLFVDQAEIDNSAEQPFQAVPGDIKYVDISGPEGVPDGVVNYEYDRTVLGSILPKYNFGMRVNLAFGNFDFSALLQGVSGVNGMLTRAHARPFDDGSFTVQRWQTDHWTPDNPNKRAAQPRYTWGITTGNNEGSDFWTVDASYVKIRNVQLGYSFQHSLLDKIRLTKLRVYLNANNLHSFNSFYDGWDPELRVTRDNRNYPLTRLWSFGLQLEF